MDAADLVVLKDVLGMFCAVAASALVAVLLRSNREDNR